MPRTPLRCSGSAGWSWIRIGVNWSVLVIVALLAYGLAAGQFPAEVPRRPEAEYVVAAIVTAVAYMGSLLAHELAHSLVARRTGVQVEGITLWLLGGVSRLQGRFRVRAPRSGWRGSGRVRDLCAWRLPGPRVSPRWSTGYARSIPGGLACAAEVPCTH